MDAKRAGSPGDSSVAAADGAGRDARPRSLMTYPLFLGALLPFGFSMYFHTHPPAAQHVEQGSERTPLVFGQYMVNLGSVMPGHEFERAWFAFMNKGTEPLTMLPPIPSCQCLRAHYADEKVVYAPGEKGRLDVLIETTKESSGEKEFVISVPYRYGENSGERELTFRVTLPEPQVALNPRALLFYQLNRDEQTQNVSVLDNRPKPLTVTSMEVKSELARPLSEPTLVEVKNRDGMRETLISVRVPGDVPERSVRETVHVKTDDADFPTIRIPIWIDGRKITLSHPTEAKEAPAAREPTGDGD